MMILLDRVSSTFQDKFKEMDSSAILKKLLVWLVLAVKVTVAEELGKIYRETKRAWEQAQIARGLQGQTNLASLEFLWMI